MKTNPFNDFIIEFSKALKLDKVVGWLSRLLDNKKIKGGYDLEGLQFLKARKIDTNVYTCEGLIDIVIVIGLVNSDDTLRLVGISKVKGECMLESELIKDDLKIDEFSRQQVFVINSIKKGVMQDYESDELLKDGGRVYMEYVI